MMVHLDCLCIGKSIQTDTIGKKEIYCNYLLFSYPLITPYSYRDQKYLCKHLKSMK